MLREINIQFSGEPGGRRDVKCQRILKRYDCEVYSQGTSLPTMWRDIQASIDYEKVEVVIKELSKINITEVDIKNFIPDTEIGPNGKRSFVGYEMIRPDTNEVFYIGFATPERYKRYMEEDGIKNVPTAKAN